MDGDLGSRLLRSGFLLLRLAIDYLPFLVESVTRKLGVLFLFLCEEGALGEKVKGPAVG